MKKEEGKIFKRIREERLKVLHDTGFVAPCCHLSIEECIENDCGIEYVHRVLKEMAADLMDYKQIELPLKKSGEVDWEAAVKMMEQRNLKRIEKLEEWFGKRGSHKCTKCKICGQPLGRLEVLSSRIKEQQEILIRTFMKAFDKMPYDEIMLMMSTTSMSFIFEAGERVLTMRGHILAQSGEC